MNRIFKQIPQEETENFLTKKEMIDALQLYGTTLSTSATLTYSKPSSSIYHNMLMIIGEEYPELYASKEYVGLTKNNTVQEIFTVSQVATIRAILLKEAGVSYFTDSKGISHKIYRFYDKEFFFDLKTCIAYHLVKSRHKLYIHPKTKEIDKLPLTDYISVREYDVIPSKLLDKLITAYLKQGK